MSFEQGALGFRIFYLERPLPRQLLAQFAAAAAPPLKTLGPGALNGWVGGRHLLDVPINEDNAFYGGIWRLTHLWAERKVPPALYRAEVRMEELALLQKEGRAALARRERLAIRQDVMERLLKIMPPQLKGMTFVHSAADNFLYTDTVAQSAAELFTTVFRKSTGIELLPLRPETTAARLFRMNLRELPPVSFSPDLPDEEAEESGGCDFLTWLWFFSEQTGLFASQAGGTFGVMVDGPLLFVRAGKGAHETVVRKGAPLLSMEAKTCLLSGKKLKRARLGLARNKESWWTTLDADAFSFQAMKLPPPPERLDPISAFQDRLTKLDLFRCVFSELFGRYLQERRDPQRWPEIRRMIQEWVSGRKVRS